MASGPDAKGPGILAESRLDATVVLMALTMDIGWVLWRPSICIPGLLVALVAQGRATALAHYVGGLSAANEWAVFLWLVGCAFWLISELTFYDAHFHGTERPTGFLGTIPFVAGLDASLYAPVMFCATATLWATFVALVGYYCSLYRAAASATTSSDEESAEVKDKWPQKLSLGECWFAPWLFMEACWTAGNLARILGHSEAIPLGIGVFGGLSSACLCFANLRRHVSLGELSLAASCGAELQWVLGNAVWLCNDAITGDEAWIGHALTAALFVGGVICALAGALTQGSGEDVARQPLLRSGDGKLPLRGRVD